MNQDTSKDSVMEKYVIDCLVDKQEIDICELSYNYPHGIGYNELRYCWVDENNNLIVESNNVHERNEEDDVYKKYYWHELTDYEKTALYNLIETILHKSSN